MGLAWLMMLPSRLQMLLSSCPTHLEAGWNAAQRRAPLTGSVECGCSVQRTCAATPECHGLAANLGQDCHIYKHYTGIWMKTAISTNVTQASEWGLLDLQTLHRHLNEDCYIYKHYTGIWMRTAISTNITQVSEWGLLYLQTLNRHLNEDC